MTFNNCSGTTMVSCVSSTWFEDDIYLSLMGTRWSQVNDCEKEDNKTIWRCRVELRTDDDLTYEVLQGYDKNNLWVSIINLPFLL